MLDPSPRWDDGPAGCCAFGDTDQYPADFFQSEDNYDTVSEVGHAVKRQGYPESSLTIADRHCASSGMTVSKNRLDTDTWSFRISF